MLDIVKFCQAHRIPLAPPGSEHTGPGRQNIDCPFCGDNKQWHLGFSLKRGNFSCWRCGGKSLWKTIGALLKTSDIAVVKREIDKYQTGAAGQARESIQRNKDIVPPAGTGPMIDQHLLYLTRRNFDARALERDWGLQGTRYLSGDWNWRIVIPIHNERGQIVAYQGRTIHKNAEPKYRMTPDAEIVENPRGLIYGLQKVPGDAVLIVEGVTGVWRLGAGAVATFGIKWKEEQANKLRQFARRYILFDPEDVAQKQAMKLAEWLSLFPGTTEVISGFATDPGDFPDVLAKQIVSNLGIRS